MLNTKSVNWGDVARKDKEIEGLENGVNALKALRDKYFPNWKELLTAE